MKTPRGDDGRGGQVVGDAADRTGDSPARGEADQRHPGLEDDEDQRYPEPRADRGQPGRPEGGGDGERVHAQREDEGQQPRQHDADLLTPPYLGRAAAAQLVG
jgi:hypothetical protein